MINCRGAYCASVIIKLLGLPLDLTPESPANKADKSNLFTGVADYVRRCKYLVSSKWLAAQVELTRQAKRLRVEYPASPTPRPMERMHSVPSAALLCSTTLG